MMRFIKRIAMTRERWLRIRAKGLLRYLMWDGLFHMGFVAGGLALFLKYYSDVDYVLASLSLREYLQEYAPWLLLFLPLGLLAALLLWVHNEERYV